ncbi:SusD/RagB family nutrient-binding outer membrane lipoprotein [Zhouia sp. PK063]|uniref:SusD/RagB family nutrient-binding outer membrane lipoprotein n=1 Tax=Zhouia sp. PK063 TaxID=3373602 RepID=UPI0037A0224B
MKRSYRNIKSIMLFSSVLMLMNSCTKDFDDINTNPTAVEDVSDASYLFASMVDKGVHANYQRNVNLYADLYSQYFANTVDGFASPQYVYNDGWVGNQWKEFYTERLKEYEDIKTMTAGNESTQNMYNMAEIYIVYLWSRLIDYRGDVPYFDMIPGEVKTYDKQADVYPDLINRLSAATDALVIDANQSSYTEGYDYLYNGDVAKWKKFGNSLRLRLAMRLVNIDPSFAKTQAEDAIADGVMTSNDDVAKVEEWSNGYYDYLDKMAVSWGNIRVSKTFTDYINSESSVVDPRAPLWLTTYNDGYEGVANGYASPTAEDPAWQDKTTINVSTTAYHDFVLNAMSCPIMFYSEVLFLQSEAALRGWNAGGTYDDLYKQGIEASMQYVGVTDQTQIDDYINGLNVDVATVSSNEAKLKQIITQKWVANFPNGIEAWADFRRTDYPDLTLPVDGVSGSATVTSGTYVKRISYPTNEHNTNASSMPADLNTVATDRMDIRLWWDTADTKTKTNGLMNSNF